MRQDSSIRESPFLSESRFHNCYPIDESAFVQIAQTNLKKTSFSLVNLSYFEIWICSLDFRQDSRKNQCDFIFMQVIWVSMIRYFMDASAELADVAIFENVHDVWNQADDYSTWLIYIPSILRQSRDNFDHFDLRHIVFLILATLENKICPYDYIFNVLTAFREFRHHSNQNWNMLSWSELKYSIFVPATKLVFNPRFVRKILLIKVNLLAQAWKEFCR